MLGSTESRARARWRAGLAAAMLLLACTFAAVVAGSAGALGEHCSGKDAHGLGAFLQTHAEERWASNNELGFNGMANPLACSGSQGAGGTPKVTYTPVSSTAALRVWGAEDSALHTKEFEFPVHFLGTDIAPSGAVGEEGTMLAKMKAALKSDLVVIPVTQTSIAIAANPPALPSHPACTVPRISPVQLQKVFIGEIKNWRQLNAASDAALGGDCDQAITRIVRDESAGTTYQFKHFLNMVNSGALPCTGKEKRTWAQLQAPFGGESPPNTDWPRNASCQEGEGPVTTVAGPVAEGEQGPLSYVKEHAGTISYGSLPEAEQWAPKQVITVSNGVKFVGPATKEGEANCAAAKYSLPEGFEEGVNVDWSQVYGSNPNIGETSETAYPICTLTWDVVPADAVGLFGKGIATTLHDYLRFVVDPEAGQVSVRHAGYQDLPGAVLEAALVAIVHIDGEEKEEEGEEEGGGGSTSGTVLCKVAPESKEGVLVCPTGKGFAGQVSGELVPKTKATFETTGPSGTFTCGDAVYLGAFQEDGTSTPGGGISNLKIGGASPCTSNLPEEPKAVIYLANPNYDGSKFVYLGALAPQGAFVLAKKKGEPMQLGLVESGTFECFYAPSFLSWQLANDPEAESPTRLIVQGSWQLTAGAEEACPLTLQQSSQLTVVQGSSGEGPSLYIAGE
jgi:ABC-type phosphate transport system substrate-binding protein